MRAGSQTPWKLGKPGSPRPALCHTARVSTDLPEGEAGDGRPRRPARIVRPARRRPARPASSPTPAPPSPLPSPLPRAAALGLDPADLAGALLADLAEVSGQDDPFEFEMLVSSFCGILDVAQAAGFAGMLPPDVVALLIAQFEARGDGLSLAVLATLALLAEGETAAAAARAAARLWRAGIVPPDWFEELDRELHVEECLRVRREGDDVLLVLLAFRRAGRRHAFAVMIEQDETAAQAPHRPVVGTAGTPAFPEPAASAQGTPVISAVAPLPAEALPEHLADLVGEIVPPEELEGTGIEHFDPAAARRLLAAALRARALRDARLELEERFAQWDEAAMEIDLFGAPPYPTMVAALRSRIEILPAPPYRASDSGPDPAASAAWGGEEGDGFEFDLDLAFPDFPAAFGAGVLEEFDDTHGGGGVVQAPNSAIPPRPYPGIVAGDVTRPRRRGTEPGVPGLPARRVPTDGPAPVYRLRIDLKGAKPPIWRRVEVPGDLTLAALHEAIQTVFEWEGCHLHVFETAYGDFGDAQVDLGDGLEDAVTIEQVLPGPGARLTYVYDYGDYWEHVVRVERTETAGPGPNLPVCTGGRRAAPPEDCGGLWAYQESLRLHGDAGADVFDLPELNRRLAEGHWHGGRRGGRWHGGRWNGFHWGPDTPS